MAQGTIFQSIQTAINHHQAGRLAEAKRIYLNVLARDPNNTDALHLLSIIAIEDGRWDQADQLIRRIISIKPLIADYQSSLGCILREQGKLDEAIATWRKALSLNPDLAEAHLNLGGALREKGEIDEAISAYRQALRINPDFLEAQIGLGDALRDSGQLPQAIAAYGQATRINPNSAEAHFKLGDALRGQGQIDEAIKACRQALRISPQYAEAHISLGNALRESGQLPQAIAAYRQAAHINPSLAEAHNILGDALRDAGQLDEAITAYRRALRLEPDSPKCHSRLGAVLRDKELFDDAIASYRQARCLKPDYAEVHSELAVALYQNGQPEESIAACHEALRLKPDFAEAYSNLGSAFKRTGELDDAIFAYRRAIELGADRSAAHSRLVYILSFHPDYDAQAILAEHRHWARAYAEPLMSEIRSHDNDRTPDRKLKVAFLSPDLRRHPVGRSLLPFFEHRDPQQIGITCYAHSRSSDVITAKLKSLADQWQDVLAMSDAQVAEKIRCDQIDILVDTSLHTAGNRLLVFAREPAPIQLTMLGPPTTTGLSTMHYRLTDPYLDPPGVSDGDYSEVSIRLPRCFWVYQPPLFETLPNNLPARTNGFVTFGCLNQFSKVTRPALELWVQILQAVPKSRLLIQAQPCRHLDAVRKMFHDGGIASDRVQYVPRTSREKYFPRYHELDICLDPFPFNSHTSSMDAIWMGVPTITLRGQTAVGRGGASILSNLGMTDWIADNPERYVSIARQMASDLPRLVELRSALRQRMLNSPLTDGKQFALDVQSAFRRVWRNWCSRRQ